MVLIPNYIERFTLLQLNQGLGLMLEFLGAEAFRAICGGVKLGVFEPVRRGPYAALETTVET